VRERSIIRRGCSRNTPALQPGELFLFKLHSPRNFIVGGGVFARADILPVSLAWDVEKQAQTLLMPVSARRQLNDLPDELWTKISIEFYKDPAEAVFKALVE
jgi:predicted ATP-dependent Lon-type protease